MALLAEIRGIGEVFPPRTSWISIEMWYTFSMRTVNFIAILTIFTQLMSLGALQSFGAVLCVEADGHAEVEERGCDCASSHAVDQTSENDSSAYNVTVSPSDDKCKPCVDIPIGNAADSFTVRFVSRDKTEPNKLPSAEVVHTISAPANCASIQAWIPHCEIRDSVSARFAPLRI